jgi:NAD(P)-dependent dehydrogenase (short-subunit alcohol dehydrogenase family)
MHGGSDDLPALARPAGAVTGRLEGRRMLVTGAGSGIGLAVAELFLQAGARVAGLDLVPNVAIGAVPLRADVSDPVAVEAAVQTAVSALGGLDGLVNAAGISDTHLAEDLTPVRWQRVLDVNLTGTFNVCLAVLPHLRAAHTQAQAARAAAGLPTGPGHGTATIVNFSSGQGLQPFARRSAYAASKAGVIAFSKCIAIEWAPAIRVNTVCPGATDTPMLRSGYDEATLREQVGPRYALGRIAQADEIAHAALYLTAPESSFVNGVALAVDGGRSFH